MRKIHKIFYDTSSQWTFLVLGPNYSMQRKASFFVYFKADVALDQQREKIQYEIQAAMLSSLHYKLCVFMFLKIFSGQNMYGFDPRLCNYPKNLYQLPKFKVLPLFLS